MRKKLLISLAILLIIGMVIGMYYSQTLIANYATSTLESKYQLQLNHEGLFFSIRGNVVCEEPRLLDKERPNVNALATADSLAFGVSVRKALGGKFHLETIDSEQFNLDLKRLPNGSLHLAHVLQRFAPQAVPQSATEEVNAQPKESHAPTPEDVKKSLPSIQLRNSQLNYTSPENTQYRLDFNELNVIPDEFAISVTNGQALRSDLGDEPLLTLEEFKILNILKPGEKPLTIQGKSIDLNGHRMGQGQFDFQQTWALWKGIVDEINAVFKKPQEEESEKRDKIFLENLQLSDVTVHLQSTEGESPPLHVHVDQVDLQDADILKLENLRVDEADQPTLEIKELSLSGIQNKEAPLEVIEISGIQLNMRERSEEQLNVVVIIERIQEIIDAFRTGKEKTASADQETRFVAGLQNVDIHDIRIRYTDIENTEKEAQAETLRYTGTDRVATINNLQLKGPNQEVNQFQVDNISAVLTEAKKLDHLQSLMASQVKLQSERNAKGFTVSRIIDPWIHLPEKFQPLTKNESTNKSSPSFRIDNLKVQQSRVRIIDVTESWRVPLEFQPVNLSWNDVVFGSPENRRGEINVNMTMTSPSSGKLTFDGQAATSLEHINAYLNFDAQNDDITAFQPYLSNQILQFNQGGMRTQGTVKIDDNILDSTLDVTLLNPNFQVKQGQGFRLDNQAVMTAMNRLRDNQGNIHLNNIQLHGNIKDPKFRFTSTFFNVLLRNLYSALFNLPGLALDVAGSGKNLIEFAIKGIGSGAANILGEIFGGEGQNKNQ